jgi:hypothetical protein
MTAAQPEVGHQRQHQQSRAALESISGADKAQGLVEMFRAGQAPPDMLFGALVLIRSIGTDHEVRAFCRVLQKAIEAQRAGVASP